VWAVGLEAAGRRPGQFRHGRRAPGGPCVIGSTRPARPAAVDADGRVVLNRRGEPAKAGRAGSGHPVFIGSISAAGRARALSGAGGFVWDVDVVVVSI